MVVGAARSGSRPLSRPRTLAAVLAITQALALVLLFVVLPFGVAAAVIAYVSWRSGRGPAPVRTSQILATGDPGHAEVLTIKSMGGFLDPRPMVRLGLRITDIRGEAPFDVEVTQSLPRASLRDLHAGDVVEVRVTADRTHAAVVLGADE